MINNSLISAKKISAIYFTIDGNMTAQTNTKTGDVMSWFVEGVPYSGNNTPAHTFLNVGGEGMIKSSDRFNGLTSLNLNSCNITSLDIGSLADIRFPVNFQVASNKLISLICPVSDNIITNFYTYSNPELLSLNLSGLTGLGGIVSLHTCAKLATLTLPVSSQTITTFNAYSNGEMLSLNLSGLTGLGGDIRIYSCAKLATLTLPTSSKVINTFYAYSNPELLSLDLSGLSKLGGSVLIHSCGKLANIIFPITSENINTLQLYYDSSLSGVIDLTPLINLGGVIELNVSSTTIANRNITNVQFYPNNRVITRLILSLLGITGNLDLSMLGGLGGNIQLQDNPNMTGVSLPTSSQAITTFHAHSNGELLSLNLSGLTGLGGSINLTSCAKLTTLTLPVSSQTITFFWAYSNPELTSLDLSGLTGLGGDIRIYSCAKLATLILPISNKSITSFLCYGSIVTTFNLSTLTGFGGDFRLQNEIDIVTNNTVTSLTLPTNANSCTKFYINSLPNIGYVDFKPMPNILNRINSTFRMRDNNWSAAIVNQVLHELNIGTTSGFTGRSISIGGTNADPDATSGGYDGLAAKANLEGKGIIVNIA